MLQPIAVSDLPTVAGNPGWVASQIPEPPGMLLTREQRSARAQELLGIAFGLVLLEHGWTMVATPGESHLVRGSETISPLEQVFGLAKGEPTAEEWVARVRDLDIASCSLSGTASPKIA